MIERTAFDLRIAAHHDTTATINATEWRLDPARQAPVRRIDTSETA